MSEEISFWVPGIPAPGGSKRFVGLSKRTGRAILIDAAGQRNKDWRNAVGWAGKEVPINDLMRGPLAVRFVFNMPRPKSHFNSKGQLKPSAPPHPTTKPDALKLARSTEDALTGIIWADDAQVVELTAIKQYALLKPGAGIAIKQITTPECTG